MPEMEPELMELFRQKAEEGELTCPKCGSKLAIKAPKCGVCGWKNRLIEGGYESK